jgi:hypothetical protein
MRIASSNCHDLVLMVGLPALFNIPADSHWERAVIAVPPCCHQKGPPPSGRTGLFKVRLWASCYRRCESYHLHTGQPCLAVCTTLYIPGQYCRRGPEQHNKTAHHRPHLSKHVWLVGRHQILFWASVYRRHVNTEQLTLTNSLAVTKNQIRHFPNKYTSISFLLLQLRSSYR